jgi:DNA-binding transcriptional MerR regulator
LFRGGSNPDRGVDTMSISIEQVAKLTKLSVATIRVYTSKQHLGTKVGNKRVYSQSDVQKLLKATGKNKVKAKQTVAPKKVKRTDSTVKGTRKRTSIMKEKSQPEEPAVDAKPQKRSFWSFLFPRAKQNKKVSLLEVKRQK